MGLHRLEFRDWERDKPVSARKQASHAIIRVRDKALIALGHGIRWALEKTEYLNSTATDGAVFMVQEIGRAKTEKKEDKQRHRKKITCGSDHIGQFSSRASTYTRS